MLYQRFIARISLHKKIVTLDFFLCCVSSRNVPTLLAIETSLPQASIALRHDGEIVLEETFTSERGHNSAVFDPLKRALAWVDSRKHCIDQIIVGAGPGSYSGTRIGIAAAQGISLARNCSIAGLGSLAATKQARISYREKTTCLAIGDARRGLYYLIRISDDGLATEPELMDAKALNEQISGEQNANLISLDEPSALPLDKAVLEHVESTIPEARHLLELWTSLNPDQQKHLNNQPISPVYLRPPFTSKAKAGHPLIRGKNG